jgi:hypothetical protein
MDGVEGDAFGQSVAISGNRVVVGAPGEDGNKGRVYVFARNQGGSNYWYEATELVPYIRASDAYFGWPVSIDGDTVAVGAYGESADAGAAYLFGRNSGGADQWGQAQRLTASDKSSGDRFGAAVAIDGQTAIVGAPYNDDLGDGAGAAYLWTAFRPQRVWFDEAHGNLNTVDWDRAQSLSATLPWHPDPNWLYFGQLKSALAPAYELISQTVAIDAHALTGYDAAIVSVPDEPLSEAEIDALVGFVRGGGGLILLGDCGFWDPSSALAARYDVAFAPYCLYAPIPHPNGDLTVVDYAPLAPVSGVTSFTVNWGQTLGISGDAFGLADTASLTAWCDVDGDDTYDTDEWGIFDVLAGYDDGCGRVAVVADNSFQDDGFEGRRNDRLMRALLTWVTGGQSCISEIYLPVVIK